MADQERHCLDTIPLTDPETEEAFSIYITCGRLVVTAKGTKVEHIHHHRDLDVPGCEQARVSWTRRR